MESPAFPASLLQRGVLVAVEPPRGVKASLAAACDLIEERQDVVGWPPETELQLVVFAVCLFHAAVQDRRRFGALGWARAPEVTARFLALLV